MANLAIQKPRKFRLTLESWSGGCKRKTVLAHSADEAMGMYMFGEWVAVAVVEVAS